MPVPIDAPPALLAAPVVYVVHGGAEGRAFWAYCGETEALRKRLARHRRAFAAPDLAAHAAPLPNRSAARRLEAALIRSLQAHGVPLVSSHDARKTAVTYG